MNKFLIIVSLLTFSLFVSAQTVTYSESITFEDSSDLLTIDTTSENIWNIGVPDKFYLDSSYSQPNAIYTDTSIYYTNNNQSAFILKFAPASYEDVQTKLIFWHKYEIDSIHDFGKIEVSYDRGHSWQNLLTDSTYDIRHDRYVESGNYFPLEDTLFRGRSHGWYQEEFTWQWYYPLIVDIYPDEMWVKFLFSSDSIQSNKEGWMIDNISIKAIFYTGIRNPTKQWSSSIHPVPAEHYVIIKTKNLRNQHLQLSIFDASGKTIMERSFSADRIRIETNELDTGVYFYRLTDDSNQKASTGKFIIN